MKKGSSPKLPKISVNKLAEFMTAKASRQRLILRDQKFPSDFKGMFYKEAAEAISSCIASNLENLDALDRQLRILEQQAPTKIGAQTSGPLCCVIDVGSKKMYPGVKSTAQRLKDIQAACQNVATLWPSITAPD